MRFASVPRCSTLPLVVPLAALAACQLPPATPGPDELAALRARVDRSHADFEGVLRLAAGTWAEGERSEAIQILREARLAVPEQPAYAAALGMALEAEQNFVGARGEYTSFLMATAWSDLGEQLVDRVDAMRGETAGALAARILGGARLAHGFDPGMAVALPRLRAPAGDPELGELAAVATDLLVRSLRDAGFAVLDWELAQAVSEALPAAQPVTLAGELADMLSVGRVVMASVERAGADSIAFVVDVMRAGAGATGVLSQHSFTTTLDAYAADPSVLATPVWEMLLGARPGSVADAPFERGAGTTPQSLLLMGEGILAQQRGERRAALELLAEAAGEEPVPPPLEGRIADLRSLEAFAEAPTLPMAEDVLAFARRRADAAALLGRPSPIATAGGGVARQGVGEAFGFDRLGAQVFVDFLIGTEVVVP